MLTHAPKNWSSSWKWGLSPCSKKWRLCSNKLPILRTFFLFSLLFLIVRFLAVPWVLWKMKTLLRKAFLKLCSEKQRLSSKNANSWGFFWLQMFRLAKIKSWGLFANFSLKYCGSPAYDDRPSPKRLPERQWTSPCHHQVLPWFQLAAHTCIHCRTLTIQLLRLLRSGSSRQLLGWPFNLLPGR